MRNPAPVLENNTHKLLWDFDIHTDHLISIFYFKQFILA